MTSMSPTLEKKLQAVETGEVEIYDVVIIGGGCAGYTAGIYAVRAGLKAILLSGPTPGGQITSSHMVENYPGFPKGISGLELAVLFEEQAVELGLKIKRTSVTKVELDGEIKQIQTRRQSFQAKTVIIATGAAARKLGAPNEDLYVGGGVSYCATCDGNFAKDKVTYVIGGGDTALGDAAYLARIAKEVHIVHRRDAFRAAKHVQDGALKNENVHVVWDSVVEGFEGENGKLTGTRLKNVKSGESRVAPVDNAFVAVGNSPQTGFLEDQVSLTDGYINTDRRCRTNLPGVFAAGDVCYGNLRQVVVAAADGALALEEAFTYLTILGTDGYQVARGTLTEEI